MRNHLVTVLAAALLATPGLAGAEAIALTEPVAVQKSLEGPELARLRTLFEEALMQAGADATPAFGGKGKATAAEFVSSLSVDLEGDELVLRAAVSRVRLDRWAARFEARAPKADEAAISGSMALLAAQIASAVREAPARSQGPAGRPAGPRLVIKRTAAATPAPAPAPAPAPEAVPADEAPAAE